MNGSTEVTPKFRSTSVSELKVNGVVPKYDKSMKPEKPERKLNNKELIEKQKNWTMHFTKSKSISKRYVFTFVFFFFFMLTVR